MSVRSWLILFLIFLFTTFPVIVLGAYTYRTISDSLTHSTLERRIALAKLGAATIQERLDRLVELAVLGANEDRLAVYIEQGKWNQALETIKSLPSLSPFIDRIFLADPAGIETAAFPLDPTVIGKDFSHRDWYKGVSEGWQPYVSGLYQRAAVPQINVVAVAVPIFKGGREEKPLGILVVQAPVTTFGNLTQLTNEAEGFFYLVDTEGNLIFHPDYMTSKDIVNFKDNESVRLVLQGKTGYVQLFNKMEDQERINAFWPIGKYGWGVVMTQLINSAFAERQASLAKVLVVWSVITFFSAAFNFVLLWFISQLADQRERERKILETINVGIYVMDTSGRINYINSSVERITGFSRKEIIGKVAPRFFQFYTFEGKVVAFYDRPFVTVMRIGKTQVFLFILSTKSGSKIPVEVVMTPIVVGGIKVGAVATIEDISERYALDKAKDEFITTSAHQLNSPLGQIRWNLDLFLNKYSAKLPRDAKQLLHDAHDSTTSLAALVNDLLVASRVTQDRLQEHPIAFKPEKAIRKFIEGLKPFIKEKNISVKVETKADISDLKLDELAFQQVMENILRNAIKYNKENGSILIHLEKENTDLLITVSDTGIGIPKKDIGSLFGKFYRASNAAKDGISGTGLGLYVVKAYVERWRGKVWIESEEGKGTTVYLRIPYEKDTAR